MKVIIEVESHYLGISYMQYMYRLLGVVASPSFGFLRGLRMNSLGLGDPLLSE